MSKFRTHYDNLKVSRDAPIEVIQAAYRSLARKYHPDRNASSPKNEAIMKALSGIEAEKSAAEGKTFGDLIKAGTLPGKNE